MPRIDVVLYKEDDGNVPLIDWLDRLPKKISTKCWEMIDILHESGYDLRRPYCDYLRDKIYELRLRYRKINYRMLYFYHHSEVIVVSHGLTKRDKIPNKEIDLAIRRRQKFFAKPNKHTYWR